jgi:hypothetical protein
LRFHDGIIPCNHNTVTGIGTLGFMGFPLPPNRPQLMIALQPLSQASWAGRLPSVATGEAFWAEARIVPSLIAAGQAEIAPPDTAPPPIEPAWTAHGSPGFGAGTSNCSPG